MRLFEEYFRRHGITIPVVQHVTTGSLVLKTNDMNRWSLLSVKWVDHPYHPGSYEIKFSRPVHNSYSKNTCFHDVYVEMLLWDDYEDFFWEWIDSIDDTPIVGNKNIILAFWEMFIYCYDSWFVEQTNVLKDLVYQSINEDLPVYKRYSAWLETINYLNTYNPNVVKHWKCEFQYRFNNYMDWLANLIIK